ncbi:MAG: alkaline phosphatase family protein, partial [Acidobacteria bacterium]|nr:alkaline phosphatase family protein [Acidobacteriota bacterium]
AAAAAVGPLPVAALLPPDIPPDQPASLAGRAPLPAPVLRAIEGALREAGVEPVRITASVGPFEAFAPVFEGAGSRAESSGGAMPPAEETGIRLLLIGLDGADWDLIDPLIRAGRLPSLARLVAGGTRASLRSYDPMISPLLWTTMATGVGPDLHGVADFQAIDPATGRRVPITSRFRKVKAIWNILSDAGKRSGFVAWWASYPAEKVVGFQVSNLAAFEVLRPRPPGTPVPAGIAYPDDYLAGIRPSLAGAADITFEEVGSVLRVGRAEFEAARAEVLRPRTADDDRENRKIAQGPVPLAIAILTGTRNYATIAADLAARRLDLTAVYFEGIDMMGHRFQHCLPPRMAICPEEDFRRFRGAVTAFYARQDDALGRVLKAAGPETTVMVVSDHGFKSGSGRPVDHLPFTTQQPVEWHDEEGVFVLAGPGARRGERLAGRVTLFDIAPTLLYLLGLPVAEEMPGRVVLGAIDPEFARAHPARTIPSYQPLGGRPEVAALDATGAAEAEQELLDSLRALGYIGGDTATGETAPAAAIAGAAGPPQAPADDTQVFYHRNLATYFLKRADYIRAAEQLRMANQRQKLPKNYQMLAEACVGLGRQDEAIAALQEGLRTIESMDPESVLWIVQLRLSSASGRSAAIDEVRRWAGRTASKPGLDDAIAGLLVEEKDTAGAAGLYRRSLGADPLRAVAAQRLYALEGRRSAAFLEPLLRRALSRDPRIDEYQNMLGAILADSGRLSQALEPFRRAADLDPDNPRFAANLAGVLARLGRWREAATAYEKAVLLSPSPGNYMKLGSVYRQLRHPGRALAAFERARALGDAGAAPILGIALARAEMDQIPEALEAVREGLGRHPGDRALQTLYDNLLRRRRSPGSAPDRSGSGR